MSRISHFLSCNVFVVPRFFLCHPWKHFCILLTDHNRIICILQIFLLTYFLATRLTLHQSSAALEHLQAWRMSTFPEPSIRRVWPSKLLARSACAVLWCHNSTRKTPCLYLMLCDVSVTAALLVFISVQVNDYLRSLRRVTIPRLSTYASNDEMAAFATQSAMWPMTAPYSPAAASLLLRTE